MEVIPGDGGHTGRICHCVYLDLNGKNFLIRIVGGYQCSNNRCLSFIQECLEKATSGDDSTEEFMEPSLGGEFIY